MANDVFPDTRKRAMERGLLRERACPAQPLGQTPFLAFPPIEVHGTVIVKAQFQADGLTDPAHAGMNNDKAVQAAQ